MNTTAPAPFVDRVPPASHRPVPGRSVAVDVTDPDLDADVRAVLAALSVPAGAPGDRHCDALVTDRAGVLPGSGWRRVVRVGSDRDPDHDDDGDMVRLPSGAGDLVDALGTRTPTGTGPLVVVVGAVGGCGTSTLASAIAVRAARSHRTLLVESDPRGTGIDLLLGAEDRAGLRVEDVRADLGGPDPDALWEAVPAVAPGLGVLARARGGSEGGPATGELPGTRVDARDGAPGAVLSHRAAGGLAVCDDGTVGESAVAAGADLVVVVTRADLPGAVAARRALTAHPDAVLVIRTGRGDPLHAADVAASTGATGWLVLPETGAIRRAAGAGGVATTLGRGRGGRARRLAALADTLLDEVARHDR